MVPSPPSKFTAALGYLGGRLLRTRCLVRAPIWLFRARLGILLGGRLVMIEHIGRTTGARRYVVLEIVDRPTANDYVVVSGFGARAQWFRNLQAHPQARIWVGSRAPVTATAQQLSPTGAAAALSAYASAHPRSWAGLKPVLEATLGTQIGADGTNLPMMSLHVPES